MWLVREGVSSESGYFGLNKIKGEEDIDIVQ
jgi:hypothetical protein